jgi:hypothetical protein
MGIPVMFKRTAVDTAALVANAAAAAAFLAAVDWVQNNPWDAALTAGGCVLTGALFLAFTGPFGAAAGCGLAVGAVVTNTPS